MNDPGVPLKEYIERVIAEHERQNVARIAALEKQVFALEGLVDAKQKALALAVKKQEAAYNIRFAGVNEWRQTFGDVVSRSVSQEVFNARYDEIGRRLNAVEQRLSNFDGRILGYSAGVGAIVLIIAIVAQLLNIGG